MHELYSQRRINRICLIASSFLYYIKSSKIIGMSEDCLFEDTEADNPYFTYYRIEPDHEILINTVTIYLKFCGAAQIRRETLLAF